MFEVLNSVHYEGGCVAKAILVTSGIFHFRPASTGRGGAPEEYTSGSRVPPSHFLSNGLGKGSGIGPWNQP